MPTANKTNVVFDLWNTGGTSFNAYSATDQGQTIRAAIGPNASSYSGVVQGADHLFIVPTISALITYVIGVNMNKSWNYLSGFAPTITVPPFTDTVTLSNLTWNLSNSNLVNFAPDQYGNWNMTPVQGAGGGASNNLLSISATVTYNNVNYTSPTYWIAVDNSIVTGTNVIMTANIYSDSANGLFVSNAYYSLDNVNWISLGSSASIPQGSTVYLKGVYSSTMLKHWTFDLIDPSHSFSHSGIASSYTLQSSGYLVGSSNFDVSFDAMLYGV